MALNVPPPAKNLFKHEEISFLAENDLLSIRR
jgi:hypothetical protein